MIRHYVTAASAVGFLLSGLGCSATAPAMSQGVLSSIHQKALEKATLRAMEQAGVSSDQFGTKKLSLTMADVREGDMGNQHVARVATDQFTAVSAGLGSSAEAEPLTCQLLMAGVDVGHGQFLFWRWIHTKAEVALRIKYQGESGPLEKEGSGMAVYEQSWFLGLGPSEKWKE